MYIKFNGISCPTIWNLSLLVIIEWKSRFVYILRNLKNVCFVKSEILLWRRLHKCPLQSSQFWGNLRLLAFCWARQIFHYLVDDLPHSSSRAKLQKIHRNCTEIERNRNLKHQSLARFCWTELLNSRSFQNSTIKRKHFIECPTFFIHWNWYYLWANSNFFKQNRYDIN